MGFEAPTVKEVADATKQDFEQGARDFYAVAKAMEPTSSEDNDTAPADD